jgi:hypothetical protein
LFKEKDLFLETCLENEYLCVRGKKKKVCEVVSMDFKRMNLGFCDFVISCTRKLLFKQVELILGTGIS